MVSSVLLALTGMGDIDQAAQHISYDCIIVEIFSKIKAGRVSGDETIRQEKFHQTRKQG
jgi:hypothetical protein